MILGTYILFCLTLGFLVAWSRAHPFPRYLAVIIMLTLVIGGPIAYVEQLGKCKSVEYEFFKNPKDIEVLASHAVEGDALYLLIDLPPVRCYSLPWEDGGKQMKKGIDQHGKNHPGYKTVIPRLIDPSTIEDRTPYEPPVQKMPPKGTDR